jgi:hypothetical protein
MSSALTDMISGLTQNISRYQRLLRTELTVIERKFIERRIAAEEMEIQRIRTVVPVENQAVSVMQSTQNWPAQMRPAACTARGIGTSLFSDKCVRASL